MHANLIHILPLELGQGTTTFEDESVGVGAVGALLRPKLGIRDENRCLEGTPTRR
jgi:hypothetical protein